MLRASATQVTFRLRCLRLESAPTVDPARPRRKRSHALFLGPAFARMGDAAKRYDAMLLPALDTAKIRVQSSLTTLAYHLCCSRQVAATVSASALLQLAVAASDRDSSNESCPPRNLSSMDDSRSSNDSGSFARRPHKRHRHDDAQGEMRSHLGLVLPPDYQTQGHKVVQCPCCKGLYTAKANGQVRKHTCVLPLSVLSPSMLAAHTIAQLT